MDGSPVICELLCQFFGHFKWMFQADAVLQTVKIRLARALDLSVFFLREDKVVKIADVGTAKRRVSSRPTSLFILDLPYTWVCTYGT